MKTRQHMQSGLAFVFLAVMVSWIGTPGQVDGALIASWDFYEGGGTSAAANEAGIGPAVFGSFGSGSQPTWVSGAPVPGATDNFALNFVRPNSGITDGGYARVTTDNVFNFPVEGNFSVAAWLKMPQPTGTTGLVTTLSTSSITGWGLVAFNDGRVQFELNPGGGARAISSTALTLMNSGEWFHVAATYEGGNAAGNSTAALRLYLNGQQVATSTVNFGGNYSNAAFPDHDLHFGAYANLTRGLQGSLDGVRIYDNVLSQNELWGLSHDYVWAGGSGAWSLGSNWDPTGIPGADDRAAIGAGGIATISDTSPVGHVTVAGGASLRLQGGVTVTGESLSLVGGAGATRGELRNVSGNNVWVGSIAVQPGQAIVHSDAGTLILSGPVTLANTTHGKLLAVGNGNVTISGNISGGATAGDEAVATSSLFSGTLTLGGANTYVGHTLINNGTLSVAGGSAIPDASPVRLFNNGRLNLQANETIGALDSTHTTTQVTLNANTLTVGGDGTSRSFAGSISGTGGVTKIGAGVQTLKGSGIAYQGNTAVSGGRLVFEDATSFGNNQPGPTTMALSNDSTLEFRVGAGTQQNVGLAGQVTISGNGSLVKSGHGTLVLGGHHSYVGETILEGGTLTLQGGVRVAGSSLWLDASDTASLTLTGNTVARWDDRSGNGRNAVAGGLSQPLVTNNPLVGGLEVVRFNGTNQILNVDLSFLAGSEYTIFAVEGRTSSRTQNYFLGTPTPSQNNGLHVGYLDNTTYRLAQHANDLDYTGLPGYTSQEFRVWSNLLDSDSGHAVYLNGANPVSNSNTVALITANNGRIGAGQRSENVQWFHADLGEILIFNHALSSTERQAVEAYLLRKWILGLSDTNVLPADTHLRIADGANLDLGGLSQTVASLADHGGGGGSVINSGISPATLNVAGSATTEFSGTLADGPAGGSLSLTHSGSGTLTLSGNNTYTGATTVLGGTLAVNGILSGTSGVAIGPGGTLGGAGAIAATVTGAGLISPGNSAGILSVDSIEPSDGMSFAFEFGRQGSPAYANAADSINDVLRLTNSTGPFESDLGVDNTIDVYLGVEDLAWGHKIRGGFYTDRDQDFLGSIEDATFNYYILGDGDGAYEFNGQAYYSLAESWPTWSFELATVPEAAPFAGGSANGYVMQLTAVPEPGTLALFACGLLGLLAFCGRRRRR